MFNRPEKDAAYTQLFSILLFLQLDIEERTGG